MSSSTWIVCRSFRLQQNKNKNKQTKTTNKKTNKNKQTKTTKITKANKHNLKYIYMFHQRSKPGFRIIATPDIQKEVWIRCEFEKKNVRVHTMNVSLLVWLFYNILIQPNSSLKLIASIYSSFWLTTY